MNRKRVRVLPRCLHGMVPRWSAMPTLFLLAILLAVSSTWGQGNQGTLEGSVADPSGAAVAGAQLTVTNDATGLKFHTTTSSDGLFAFPVLPVGTYTVEVEHAGFSKLTRKEITLTVGARLNLSLALSVAGRGESVTVTGETPLVETTRSQVSATVNDTLVENLPTNGRNFINFALLTPGVTLDVRGGDISFAGQRGTLNSLIVDGSDNNNTFFGQSLGRTGSGRAPYQFSEDAVQEFQVNSNAYSAELGHAGGAASEKKSSFSSITTASATPSPTPSFSQSGSRPRRRRTSRLPSIISRRVPIPGFAPRTRMSTLVRLTGGLPTTSSSASATMPSASSAMASKMAGRRIPASTPARRMSPRTP